MVMKSDSSKVTVSIGWNDTKGSTPTNNDAERSATNRIAGSAIVVSPFGDRIGAAAASRLKAELLMTKRCVLVCSIADCATCFNSAKSWHNVLASHGCWRRAQWRDGPG